MANCSGFMLPIACEVSCLNSRSLDAHGALRSLNECASFTPSTAGCDKENAGNVLPRSLVIVCHQDRQTGCHPAQKRAKGGSGLYVATPFATFEE